MKILLVNKFHYLKGGSEKYYFELGELLKKNGHEVAYLSMENKENVKTGDSEFFVKEFDLNNSSKLKALNVIYSKENKKIMEKVLQEFKPDIVHLNNFQRQLSASIVYPVKKMNIPIVFTAHDVQAICPAITMMDTNRNVCELCTKGKYLNCIKKKCVKNSLMKSVLGAIEGYYYRYKKIYSEIIDCIITPSEFCKKKFINDGISQKKVHAIHNYIDTSEYNVKKSIGDYALYIGRLSKEKGILNLVKAFSKMKCGKLHIAGDGPEKEEIINIIKKNNMENRIKLLGFLKREEVTEEIAKCNFVVIPSICNENCPYSALEAMAVGKPIIGANIGGIPELIEDNKNGFVYKHDDLDDLNSKMEKLFNDKEMSEKFSKNSKQMAEELYSKEKYYNDLITIYKELLGKKNAKKD